MRLTSTVHEVDDLDAFIELAYEQGWTDGLPVYPPTDDAGRGDDRLPRSRPAAKSSASCRPARASPRSRRSPSTRSWPAASPSTCRSSSPPSRRCSIPRFELLRVQATTAGPAPLAIVSGPVVKQLGFNYGAGAFTGTGHRANATIGRAIRLDPVEHRLRPPGPDVAGDDGPPGALRLPGRRAAARRRQSVGASSTSPTACSPRTTRSRCFRR